MGEACYTCDYVMRERNEITGEYLYFCKKLRKSVLWGWHCGFYKHVILSPDEQDLQDLMDKMTNEIYSQLGLSSFLLKEESATETAINAYNTYMQKKLEEKK